MWTDVSIFSGVKGASVTPEKRIHRNKRNMKSPAIYPPRTNTITNQYINRLITEQYPSRPPIILKNPPEFQQLFNDKHDPNST